MVEQINTMACFGNEMLEKEFTLKKGVTFLNHGSYGAVPRRIQEAQKRIIDEVYSFPDLWYRRNKRLKQDEALRCIAEFVNADPEDVVFVRNATTGVNSVLKSLHFEPGDVILCTDNTYKAVKNTCEATLEFSHFNDVRTDYLPLKFPIHKEDDVVEMYREYLEKNPKVKIAVIDHITSPSAIKMPIEKLIEVCKEFGVMTLIDGAHAPGQIPLDMRQLDADFYTGNLHKWLYAPTGCAILYVRKKHQQWIRPVVTSHGHKVDFQTDFFNQGTCDESPYCVVPEVLKFYNEIGGYEKIRKYTDDLLCEATELLTSSWKTEKLPIPKSMEAPFMRMVEMPKLEGLSTGAEAEKGIVENLLHHSIVSQITCVDGKIYSRLGCNIYNVKEDYQRLCEMEKIRKYTDDLLCEATELLTSSWKTEKLPIPKSMEAPFMRMVEMPKLEGLSTGAEAEKGIVENLLHHSIVSQITCVDGKIYSRLGCNIYNVKEDYQRLCEMVLNQLK